MADMNKLRPFAFVLAVQDLERNTAYFRDVLGFRVDWGDSSDWHLVARGDVRIMLGSCPDAMPPAQTNVKLAGSGVVVRNSCGSFILGSY